MVLTPLRNEVLEKSEDLPTVCFGVFYTASLSLMQLKTQYVDGYTWKRGKMELVFRFTNLGCKRKPSFYKVKKYTP